MNSPTDIIAFCKDWHEPATSNNHVMVELAKRHRVLWVNSIATRAPNLASGNDLRKIIRKLRSWCRGTEIVHDRLRVLTPIILPLPQSTWAVRLNRWLVRWLVRSAARRWRLGRPQLWIFPPNAVDYIGQFDESMVVYYCVDEWSEFTHLDTAFIQRKEHELLEKADAVFVVSEKLLERKKPLNPNTHLIRHGVDWEKWRAALRVPEGSRERQRAETPPAPLSVSQDSTPLAGARGYNREPMIGFYGNLYDWVDQDLIAGIARQRPDWKIVLVGKIMSDVSQLESCPNIELVGPRPYQDLPGYCAGWDVGMIPYRTDDPRMQSINPLKLREYLAAGLPVVAVDLPEIRAAGEVSGVRCQVSGQTPTALAGLEGGAPAKPHRVPDIQLAAGADQFIAAIEQAIDQDTEDLRRARSDRMKPESWAARIEQVEGVLANCP